MELLCPELMEMIASSDPRAYGVMMLLNKGIRRVIGGIDPWALFTIVERKRYSPVFQPTSLDCYIFVKSCKIKSKYIENMPLHGVQVEVNDPSLSRHLTTSTTYTWMMYGKPIESTKWVHVCSKRGGRDKMVYKSRYTVWVNGNPKITKYKEDGADNSHLDYGVVAFWFGVLATVALIVTVK